MFLRIRRQYDLTLNAIQFSIEGSRKCHTFKYNHYNIVQQCDVHETAYKLDSMMKMLHAGKECFLTSYNTVVFFFFRSSLIEPIDLSHQPRSGFIDQPSTSILKS